MIPFAVDHVSFSSHRTVDASFEKKSASSASPLPTTSFRLPAGPSSQTAHSFVSERLHYHCFCTDDEGHCLLIFLHQVPKLVRLGIGPREPFLQGSHLFLQQLNLHRPFQRITPQYALPLLKLLPLPDIRHLQNLIKLLQILRGRRLYIVVHQVGEGVCGGRFGGEEFRLAAAACEGAPGAREEAAF